MDSEQSDIAEWASQIDSDSDRDESPISTTANTAPTARTGGRNNSDEDSQWKGFYSTIPLGGLPPVDVCKAAHSKYRYLQHIQIRRIPPTRAVAYHFFPFYSTGKIAPPVPPIRLCTIDDCSHTVTPKTSTTIMADHIGDKHRDIWEALQLFRTKQEEAAEAKRLQPTISESFHRTGTKPLTKSQSNAFLRSVTKWIAKGLVPMSYLEQLEFRQMLHILDSRYRVPSIRTFKKDLRAYKAELTNKLIDIIGNCGKVAMTADGWKSSKGESFFGVTLHYVTDDWNIMTITLAMQSIAERQVASFLKETLSKFFFCSSQSIKLERPLIPSILVEVLRDWSLSKKVLVGTTDSGSNIKKAMAELGVISGIGWLPCAAHTIQLCIQTAIKISSRLIGTNRPSTDICRMDRVIDKCHDLAVFIRRTSTVRKQVHMAQEEYNRRPGLSHPRPVSLSVILDVPTRWNSQYFMVERILHLLGPIQDAETELGCGDTDMQNLGATLINKMLSPEEEAVAKDFLTVLKPAVEFTAQVSAENMSTISQVYPAIWDMIEGWEAIKDPDPVTTIAGQALRRALVTEAKRRWTIHKLDDFCIIAMYLNPCTRDHSFASREVTRGRLTASFLVHGHELVYKKICDMSNDGYSFPQSSKRPRCSSEEDEQDNEMDSDGAPMRSPQARMEAMVKKELERYESHQATTRRKSNTKGADPLDWWRTRHVNYRYLPVLARHYLAIQASSVASERLFSDAGNLVSKKRTGLSSAMIADLLYVRRAMGHEQRYQELQQLQEQE